jgi:hypothetical protein
METGSFKNSFDAGSLSQDGSGGLRDRVAAGLAARNAIITAPMRDFIIFPEDILLLQYKGDPPTLKDPTMQIITIFVTRDT